METPSNTIEGELPNIAALPADEVLGALATSAAGLTSEKAAEYQGKFGKNLIQAAKKKSPVLAFLSNFTHLMAILLWVAGIIALVAGMPELCVAVWLVNLINGCFSFWQEHQADKAPEALKKMLPSYVNVIRDGEQIQVLAEDLVPGDVMVLAEGDKISADGRVIRASDLQVDQSTLTGESNPVRKTADAVCEPDLTPAETPNLVFAGTSVSEGNGRVVVTRIGMATEFGKIASLTQNMEESESPLQRQLDRLTKQVTLFAMCMGVAFFLLDVLFVHNGLASSFIFALGMVVAFIPEGLLPTVTLSLAMAVQRMSKRNALVKKLSSVEALGSTSVICTDKTGTLTQNKMTVVKHELAAPKEEFLAGMALCSDAKWDPEAGEAVGEPTECALVNDAGKAGLTGLVEEHPRVGEAPFDSGRKMMSVVVETLDDEYEQYTKGGPDVVLGRCTTIYDGNKIVPLTDERRAELVAANKSMADQALRVLALASRHYTELPTDFSADALEHDLTFCGLSGMIDPERPEVAPAIAEAHAAGIRTVMITGDHIDTAMAIARELGILTPETRAITGSQLNDMSDEGFDRQFKDINTFMSELNKLLSEK